MHLMLDLETLGVSSATAPILSIGAVYFDPLANRVQGETGFYRVTTYNLLAHPSSDFPEIETLIWWLKQEDGPRMLLDLLTDKSAVSLWSGIDDLRLFCEEGKPEIVWTRGAFDVAILQEKYRRFHMDTPWKFNKVRDVRTLEAAVRDVYGNSRRPRRQQVCTPHNALYDAIYQARCVQEYVASLQQSWKE